MLHNVFFCTLKSFRLLFIFLLVVLKRTCNSFISPQKNTVKTLFGGVITNNVVSLVGEMSLQNKRMSSKQEICCLFLKPGRCCFMMFCVIEMIDLQDCDHVSQTAEEFYTVRCQVADMKNIYVSISVLPALSAFRQFDVLTGENNKDTE